MPPTLSPAERALFGAIGAARRWGSTPDRTAATAPARAAFASKWLREASAEFPDATDAQLAAMAEQRRIAFYKQLAVKSVAARRRKAIGRG